MPQPPQPAIMAACTAQKMAVVVEKDGEDVIVPRMMKLVIDGDHRILDGTPLAAFLNDMKKLLEDPEALVK